jgi:hypothetical protein
LPYCKITKIREFYSKLGQNNCILGLGFRDVEFGNSVIEKNDTSIIAQNSNSYIKKPV